MVNKRKEETMTNKLDNNQFEYKDKDQIKSFILKMDYERKYKYCFVSPQEVLEDFGLLDDAEKQEIFDLISKEFPDL